MTDPLHKPSKPRRESSEEFACRCPHHHLTYFNRPHISRRAFFQLAGAGLAGSFLARPARAVEIVNQGMTTQNTARNVIFVMLIGAISHVDTWDLKVTSGVTPASFNPSMINGVNWPTGLLPKLATHLDDIALVRSMSAWALVHPLAQTWAQIGRNPAAALGDIAPNIGSIVSIEKEPERRPGQVFPTFVGLNAQAAAGSGYLSTAYAPFQVDQARAGSAGIPNTTNVVGQTVFDGLYTRLQQYDGPLRAAAPYGQPLKDMDALYTFARGMMYDPAVEQAFAVSDADSARYGSSPFGNACLVANQVIAADQGTRFIQINYGSWDHHADIYGEQNPNGQNLITMSPALDDGLSALLDDLKGSGHLNDTLVVVVGEFGRTPGISAAGGRDHYLLTSAVLAGGGVKGGKVIGATNADGSEVTEYGWAGSGDTGPRYVRPEDIESTIYSALGIDWTSIRYDDPFGRGFEYVPFGSKGTYGPVNELFS